MKQVYKYFLMLLMMAGTAYTTNAQVTANAGPDSTICASLTPVLLQDASASNYSLITWTTFDGGGTFTDGSTVNATYNQVEADTVAGFVNLIIAATPIWPATGVVADTMKLSFQPLPNVDAGSNVTICSSEDYTLQGQAWNTISTSWFVYVGTGTLDDASKLDAIYTPPTGPTSDHTETLRLTGQPIDPCTTAQWKEMTIHVVKTPTVDAGSNATICEDAGSYTVDDASGLNYTSVSWGTDGTGSFTGDTGLTPTYTLGTGETGVVTLTLYADPNSPCVAQATDDMTLTIHPTPEVTDLTLQTSTDQSSWTAVGGTFATNFELCIDSLNEYYYLDVNTFTASETVEQSYFQPFLFG